MLDFSITSKVIAESDNLIKWFKTPNYQREKKRMWGMVTKVYTW